MQWMVRVYETGSEDFRNKMEAYLIEFYKDHSENKIGGGGGGAGAPPYSIYVAWTCNVVDLVDFKSFDNAFRYIFKYHTDQRLSKCQTHTHLHPGCLN